MLTPVFLDNLPDIGAITGRRGELHRLQRNKALADLLLEEGLTWQERVCPACGTPGPASNFTRSPLPFRRCSTCNTIHATRVPPQHRLDGLRHNEAADLLARDGTAAMALREAEYVSILNWLRLSAPRYASRGLSHVLDYRFASHAAHWSETADRLGDDGLRWTHLPLDPGTPGDPPFADLARALDSERPEAVLVQSELDRCADPQALLAVLRAGLPPGGLVFLSSSCADGLEYEILGADSPSFVPLDRLTIFSVRGFSALARRSGFDCLEISTPGRLDTVLLQRYFTEMDGVEVPFWSGFFRNANRDRLQDLQLLLQRSLRSGVMRFVLRVC